MENTIFKTADETGYVEVTPGVYLQTAGSLISEQAGWADGDECKTFDFTTAPYWLTTNNGSTPIAIANTTDLAAELA